jgi:hypothetical protein
MASTPQTLIGAISVRTMPTLRALQRRCHRLRSRAASRLATPVPQRLLNDTALGLGVVTANLQSFRALVASSEKQAALAGKFFWHPAR